MKKDFSLPGTDGRIHKFSDYKEPILVVFFTCNHCPYVVNSDEITARTAKKYELAGVKFVGINSNASEIVPSDGFQEMIARMEKHNFPWDYLHDETQEVARNYSAVRTPHFFVFDENRNVIYQGRGVDNPRHPDKITTFDLENALESHLAGRTIEPDETPPVGCTVKYRS